jgi:hypothetical protein
MSLLTNALRDHIRDSEAAIATLNRQLVSAIATGHPTHELRAEIRAISERRNFILARLNRLSGAETMATRPSKPGTEALESSF